MLQDTESMLLIKHKVAAVKNLTALERDSVVLNWEERRKSRQRLKTTKGIEIAVALPTGTILYNGDILYINNNSYIAVEAAEEDVVVIYPDDMTKGAVIAYEIGNRHLPISINGDTIMTPYNHVLEDYLKKEAIQYEHKRDVFEPIKRGHSHG